MKKPGFFRGLIFWGNVLAALMLAISFLLPFVPPKSFPTLSLLSLLVSPLILANLIFFVYWVVLLDRRLFISMTVLVISYFHFNVFYEFSSKEAGAEHENSLRILTYNVRLFNAYEKKPGNAAAEIIPKLLEKYRPDVVCIQEYYLPNTVEFSGYPHKYVYFKNEKAKLGHAIFSKYPLLNTGSLDFENTFNNGLFADVAVNADTLRIYNLHLQSFGISPHLSALQDGDKEKLRQRLVKAFAKQQDQVTVVLDHKSKSPYPVIISGDFNNTPYSYTYQKLQTGMQDAFKEKGEGLGTTFKFDKFPMRIDYIFASDEFEVLDFEKIGLTFSDHYPLLAELGWPVKE